MKCIIVFISLLIVTLVNGFHVSNYRNVKTSLKMSSDFSPKSQVGSSGPLGFFDPLGFSSNISEKDYKIYQEAEIKHARVAMLAFVGLLAGEVGPHPFFDGAIGGPSIYQFQQTYDSSFPFFWLVLVAGIANVEIGSIFKNWTSISDTFGKEGGKAKLKDNAVPGNLGFDPLGLGGGNSMRTKELNNGRLAMIGCAGFVVQELVTGQAIF